MSWWIGRVLAVLAAVAAAAVVGEVRAAANWITEVEDDVLTDGRRATMIGAITFNAMLYFACTGEGEASVSYIERGDYDPGFEALPVVLVIRVDDGQKHILPAAAYRHNAEYFGFRSTDAAAVAALARELEAAKRIVGIGLTTESVGFKWSGTAPVAGSTAAAKRFREGCALP